MRLFVYLPLLLPLLAAVAARPVASRLPPRQAVAVLATAGVVLATCSTGALGLLAAAGVAKWALLAHLGGYSHGYLRHADPTTAAVGSAAAAALAAASINVAVTAHRRARALADAYRHAATLGSRTHGRLVVVDDTGPDACAVPGWPGRVVVTSAMLDALDSPARRALLAHEHAHLACHHHLFVSLARIAAAANPCLLPLARSLDYSIERWADEHAARTVGDRQLVAHTIARAALLQHRSRDRRPGAALGVSGPPTRTALAGAGPVPRRVAALLRPPTPSRPGTLTAAAALPLLAGIAALEATHDLAILLRAARAIG